jgi:hypothetical protein
VRLPTLSTRRGVVGALNIASRRRCVLQADADLLHIAGQVAIAVVAMFREISDLKNRLAEESCTRGGSSQHDFKEIAGAVRAAERCEIRPSRRPRRGDAARGNRHGRVLARAFTI